MLHYYYLIHRSIESLLLIAAIMFTENCAKLMCCVLIYYSPIWNSYSIFDIHDFQIFGRSNGEGNGNPLQYSYLENPMEEDPGGLQSMGSQIFGLASYQVPCDFNVLISWNVNTVHLIKSTSANFFSFVRLLHFLHYNYHFDER